MAGASGPAGPVSPEVVKGYQAGWEGFTRLVSVGVAVVLVILLAMLLHFATGWGFAMFFMVLGFLGVGFLMLIGKL